MGLINNVNVIVILDNLLFLRLDLNVLKIKVLRIVIFILLHANFNRIFPSYAPVIIDLVLMAHSTLKHTVGMCGVGKF